MALAQMNPREAFELADMVVVGSVDAVQMGKAIAVAARKVILEGAEASRGDSRNKIAKILTVCLLSQNKKRTM